MNSSKFKPDVYIQDCAMNEAVWSIRFLVEKEIFAVASITVNALTCPAIIVLNVLVIAAIKTTPTLQTKYNILLACLAGTDIAVGMVLQPSAIAGQILVLKGLSLNDYCDIFRRLRSGFGIPLRASLYHLTLLSVEPYVALRYPLRYPTIITTFRIKVAVVCAWFFSVCPTILDGIFNEKVQDIVRVAGVSFSALNLVVIVYCLVSVYFVIRRYKEQIHTEEQLPQEADVNFVREKTAAKTTRIIIIKLALCYFPFFAYVAVSNIFSSSDGYFLDLLMLSQPLIISFSLVNSLCNPIICFYKNKMLRGATIEMLRNIICYRCE